MSTDNYLSHLSAEKIYSEHTINAYRSDLTQFSDYIGSEYGLSDVTEVNSTIVRSWLVHLMEGKKSAKSINRKLTSVKSYFNFLRVTGVLEKNPASNVAAPKIPKKLPVFVRDKEIEILLDEIEFEKDHQGVRSRLILEILYSCGIRLDELINIQHRHINKFNRTIKIHGKGNKERLVPVYPKVIELIDEYISIKSNLGFKESYLLMTDKGKKLYPKLVYRTVNTYLNKVTTISKKSPHVLRHTFATHMLNNGADLNSIKEILGHSSLAATQVYAHNSMEKLKNIYKQAHPRA